MDVVLVTSHTLAHDLHDYIGTRFLTLATPEEYVLIESMAKVWLSAVHIPRQLEKGTVLILKPLVSTFGAVGSQQYACVFIHVCACTSLAHNGISLGVHGVHYGELRLREGVTCRQRNRSPA